MVPSPRLEVSPASLQPLLHLTSLSMPSCVSSLFKEDLALIHIRKKLNKVKDQITIHHVSAKIELRAGPEL